MEQSLQGGPDCSFESDVPSAEEWVRIADGCRVQDERSFERLVELTQADLRRLIGRIAGRRADRDELLQETYLKAWRSIARFRGECSLKTWLTRIAVNVSINWHRARRPVVSLDHAMQRLPAAASMDDRSVAQAFEQALDRLAPELRATFVLHESDGMSYRQIAHALDCPIGTVMSRLHRARELLIAELRERLDELIL